MQLHLVWLEREWWGVDEHATITICQIVKASTADVFVHWVLVSPSKVGCSGSNIGYLTYINQLKQASQTDYLKLVPNHEIYKH